MAYFFLMSRLAALDPAKAEPLSGMDMSALPVNSVKTPATQHEATTEHKSATRGSTDAKQDALKKALIARLLKEYTGVISNIAIQVTLSDLRDFVVSQYPTQGISLFQSIVRAAFPAIANDIFSAIAKMDAYDKWLMDNLRSMNDMNYISRNETLWNKRIAVFGERDARKIWSEELTASQERQQSMQKTITLLNKDNDTPIDERLYLLKTTLDENYNNTVDNLMIDHSMIAKVFLGFDSVQKDLAKLPIEQRQAQINSIRKQLGYSQEQVEELAKSDAMKEARWQNGYKYMAEREALLKENLGSNQDQALSLLRVKYFKREAPTIAKEEAGGFYRYLRPRLYGRN